MRRQPELKEASYCAYQAARGNAGEIDLSTMFVSWSLASTLPSLVHTLEAYVTEQGIDPATKFWVCDQSIRQSEGKDADVPRLGKVVAANKTTLVFIDVWDKMVKT